MFGVPRRVVAVGLVVLLLGGGIASLPVAATADHGAVTGASDGAAAGVGENCTYKAETASGQRGPAVETVQSPTATTESNGSLVRIRSADMHRRQPRGQGGDTAGTAAPAAASMETGTATSGATQTKDGDVIQQTQTYARVPEEPGEVAVTVAYEVPDRVVDLETHVPATATVTGTDGFERVNESVYEWEETTDTATISYRINPNQTIEKSGPEGSEGRYLSVDTGEWALLTRSLTPTRWRYTGQDPVRYNRTLRTAGPGAAGEEIVYLGEVATFEETAHDQTFTLAVPERSAMTASPISVLDSMANASNALRVGDRDEQVFVVAAPSGAVEWGVEGYQIGDADMWVQSRQTLDTANNVWLHEYVHSRQAYETTQETRWTVEGWATYYAAVLTLEQNRIGFDEFREQLAVGGRPVYSDVTLTDRASWTSNANYRKGALVAGRADVHIRSATGRNQTLQSVFQSLNGYRDPVTQSQFLTEVEAAGGETVRNTTATETETTATVTMWNGTTHRQLFGAIPARIGYGLPPVDRADAYRADSLYRPNAPVGGSEPIRLVTNETLAVDAVVENAGGEAGAYNVTLAVNETVVAAKQGQIEPGERTEVEVTHTFADPGRYAISVDGDTVTVVVTEPAAASVTNVTASPKEVRQGDEVDVTATVANDNGIPGTITVEFRRSDVVFAEQRLYLPPQTTTTVTRTVTLDKPGTVSLSAGDGQTTTAVEVLVSTETAEPTPTQTPTEPLTETQTTAGEGNGFTALVTGLAMLLAALIARQRSS
ncbi:CARDB domain-containing protein [Haloarcula marismortui]|uniref:Peptidase n=1 Tax=Haloarcula marismortui ATCC 33800 TaxID=662476 RepID=M0K5Q5_9EURY|nr:CARDB domain-containing protein [Haloarcula sinaiiensis]EMA15150.1 glycyl aminopeptidase [Haloarcula sinaiiensis ATCC 33800]QUJ71991.1 peptidase [Haloarcula sinaiiensis ATCC 33800]